MQDNEQRLLSRFKWGLSAELHQPDYETRVYIKKIFYTDGVIIPDDIVEYALRNIKSNV
jgi:chromosomal replication initiator protein